MLQSGGTITLMDVRYELGKSSGVISMNDSNVRALAGKSSGVISMSDFYGKRHRDGYHLIGSATNELQISTSFDSGVDTQAFYNIPNTQKIKFRVWAASAGSHDSSGPQGYVYIAVRVLNRDTGALIKQTVLIDKSTSGDGAGGVGQWTYENTLSALGATGNTNVEILKRYKTGGYTANIWGGRHHINRICGIESNIGYSTLRFNIVGVREGSGLFKSAYGYKKLNKEV